MSGNTQKLEILITDKIIILYRGLLMVLVYEEKNEAII